MRRNEIVGFFMKQTDLLLLFAITLLKQYWFLRTTGIYMMGMSKYMLLVGSTGLLLVLLLVTRGKWRIWAIGIFDFISTFLLLGNMLYYRYFGDFISVRLLKQTGQIGDIKEVIFGLIHWKEYFLFLTVPLLILYAIWLRKKEVILPRKTYRILTFMTICIGIIVSGFMYGMPIHKYTKLYGKNLWVQSYSNVAIYRAMGINGYQVYDIYRFFKEDVFARKTLNETEEKIVRDWYSGRTMPATNQLVSNDTNLIVVQLESFQSFMLHKTVDGKEITPNLNRFVKESMYFDHVYDQSAQGRTSDAETMVNTSLHPLSMGSVAIRYPLNEYSTIAKQLKKTHHAISFHGNNGSFWNRTVSHKEMGFDTFYSLEKLKDTEKLGPFLSDKELFSQAADIFAKEKKPFYAYMIMVSSHVPFYYPKDQSFTVGSYEGTTLGDYFKSVHYVDEQFGMFLEKLEKSRLLNKSMIVVYGDHNTTIMYKNKEVGKFMGIDENSMEMKLADKTIPLMIRLPNADKKGTVIQKPGGLMDVAPTILSLYGLQNPWMMGMDLRAKEEKNVVFRYGDVMNSTHYSYVDNRSGQRFCYNLKTKQNETGTCNEIVRQAALELQISDLLITYNGQKTLKTPIQ